MQETTLRPIQFSVRALIVAVALLALVLGLGRYFLSWDLHPATVAKVKAGMTKAEVQEILGTPESKVTHEDGVSWWYIAYRFTNNFYEIEFDSNGCVTYVSQKQLWF